MMDISKLKIKKKWIPPRRLVRDERDGRMYVRT